MLQLSALIPVNAIAVAAGVVLAGAGALPAQAGPQQMPHRIAHMEAEAAGAMLHRVSDEAHSRADLAAALLEALDFPEIAAILSAEGQRNAAELDSDMLGTRGGAGWARAIARIYDPARMEARFASHFAEALPSDPELAELALDFFQSERGQRFVTLENAARRAMLDDDVDEAARAHAAEMVAEEDPRLALIREMIEVNDFVESNVAGGLNSNFAFFLGLRDSGAPNFDLSDGDILAQVWSQEEVIREDVEEWLLAYLSLAYRPMEDDDLRAYVAFSETPQGRAMNRALFSAFDTLFNDISRDLGREAGRVLGQQDL